MNVSKGITGTLRNQMAAHQPIILENHPADSRLKICEDETFQTLSSRMGTGGGNVPMIMETVAIEGNGQRPSHKGDGYSETDKSYTLNQTEVHGVATNMAVRKLTPIECERLQGFPDSWTDIGEWTDSKGKKHVTSDSARYKALGNSIATPQWKWIAERLKPYLGDCATLGSLFDGIGGFPFVWEQTFGERTARWASEIEEFPIAVTKIHFPEGD
jgi:site-specific DNA-cytosine methylase